MSMWILPAGTYGTEDESWRIFKNESYIGIDYTFDDETVDYSSFNSQDEIEDYLGKNIGKKSYVPSIIWKFVNDFKIGDLVIIRKGTSKL